MNTQNVRKLTLLSLAITSLLIGTTSMIYAAGSDSPNGNQNKVEICHIEGSGPGKTISVDDNALAGHASHEFDTYDGACTLEQSSDSDEDGIRNDIDSCPEDPTNRCNDPEDITAPEILVSQICSQEGNLGWCVGNVTVQWTVTERESEATIIGCVDTTVSSDVEGLVLSCSATSEGGSSTLSVTINRDATAPVITTGTQSPAANENGWNNSEVTVDFTCSDNLSGVVLESFTQTVSSEGSNQSTSAQCEDLAGNTSSATYSGINIDMTDPVTSSGTQSPAANENGWNNSEVTVDFTCSDELSGAASDSVSTTIITEGAEQSAIGQCEDLAGNTSSATYEGINIDWTAPSIYTAFGLVYLLGEPVEISCEDELSGLASCEGTLNTNNPGTNSQVVTAIDIAGNVATPSVEYEIHYDLVCGTGDGFKSPIPNTQYKIGRIVPEKFIACDYYGMPVSTVVARSYIDTSAATSPGKANDDNYFRYDPIDMQYIFNMNSKGISLGYHTLSAVLDSNQVISATVNFTK